MSDAEDIAAIRRDAEQHLSEFHEDLTVTVSEVTLAGDWAISNGTYSARRTPKAGGERTADSGKWLDVMQRQPDGTWRIYRDIWNRDR